MKEKYNKLGIIMIKYTIIRKQKTKNNVECLIRMIYENNEITKIKLNI